MGRDKARVGLKLIWGGENVGGPRFWGLHFGAQMRPKSVQKRHAKIDQIQPHIFLEIETDLGLILGFLVDKIAIQFEKRRKRK